MISQRPPLFQQFEVAGLEHSTVFDTRTRVHAFSHHWRNKAAGWRGAAWCDRLFPFSSGAPEGQHCEDVRGGRPSEDQVEGRPIKHRIRLSFLTDCADGPVSRRRELRES